MMKGEAMGDTRMLQKFRELFVSLGKVSGCLNADVKCLTGK